MLSDIIRESLLNDLSKSMAADIAKIQQVCFSEERYIFVEIILINSQDGMETLAVLLPDPSSSLRTVRRKTIQQDLTAAFKKESNIFTNHYVVSATCDRGKQRIPSPTNSCCKEKEYAVE